MQGVGTVLMIIGSDSPRMADEGQMKVFSASSYLVNKVHRVKKMKEITASAYLVE